MTKDQGDLAAASEDDIVARLRELWVSYRWGALEKAATEIERLRTELAGAASDRVARTGQSINGAPPPTPPGGSDDPC